MTLKELYGLLASLELPIAYHQFEEGHSPSAPFILYLFRDSENLGADNGVYHKELHLEVEVYSSKKDVFLEEKVEALLDAHFLYYDKDETYLASEGLYQLTYHLTIKGG